MDDAQKMVREFRNTRISRVRESLAVQDRLDSAAVETMLNRELKNPIPDTDYLEGLANALVALLPRSTRTVERLLSQSAPNCIYELHFSIFGALGRSDLNDLEQDGIEYMLMEYLLGVKSTSAYAAWKAGLVLGEDWLSPRAEHLLVRLMMTAKFPAGRMGAINGYRFVVERRKSFTTGELSPLRIVARSDKSSKVRGYAKFHLSRLREMSSARGSIGSSGGLVSPS